MPIVGSFAGASSRAYGLQTSTPIIYGLDSIQTTTVGSGGTSSITFSSIPQTYKHLQIRGIARCAYAGTGISAAPIEFNSDTTATNYWSHRMYGSGTASGGDGENSSRYLLFMPNNNNSANVFSGFVITIFDYTNTNKYKTSKGIISVDYNGGGFSIMTSQHWRNTNAISSIKISASDGNLAQYTSLSLYGIKEVV